MKGTRRDVLALGAAGLFLSATQSTAGDAPELSEVEKKNEKMVNDFCAAWSTLDVNKIADFLSDKVIYQMIDNVPLIKGKEAFTKVVGAYLSKVDKAQWDISRSYVIGDLVLNQRVDNFDFKGDRADAHFKVIGFFLIRDGKIAEWKDYRLPGDKGSDS